MSAKCPSSPIFPLTPETSKNKQKQITNIKSETENITVNSADIKRVKKEYYKKIFGKKIDNLDERRKFLQKHK